MKSASPARDRLVIGLSAIVAVAAFAGWAAARGQNGYPLDDAWIHQTYARNLAATGQWAYSPGEPSAGSTSPLWTLLLAAGYAIGLPARAWTLALGAASLAACALLARRMAARLFGGSVGLAAGLLCALEWHMVWSAASGMETVLFAALVLAVLDGAVAWAGSPPSRVRALALGLLSGAAVLARPDALLPIALAGGAILLARVFARPTSRGEWLRGLIALLGMAALVTPYLWVNLREFGAVLPNTFYAKQVEYSAMAADTGWLARLLRLAAAPLAGAGALLAPGAVLAAVWLAARRRWVALLPLVWWLATLIVYGARLPVTYQHGRYLIPTLPVVLVMGAGGIDWALRAGRNRLGTRVVTRAWAGALAVATLAFLWIGARTYDKDVAIIDCEMVRTAQWLRDETPPGSLIAAHDIGAIGYFSDRRLLDLAGLVSPEIIPFMRDESRLLDHVRGRGATYLVTFPSWYPAIASDATLEPLFDTECEITRRSGGDNMVIYAVPPSP